MGDEAAEVPANNTMPCCTLPLVELSTISVSRERGIARRQTVRLMWWAISCKLCQSRRPGNTQPATRLTFSTVNFSIASWAEILLVRLKIRRQ